MEDKTPNKSAETENNEDLEKLINKPRLSLFLPPDVTTSEQKTNNFSEDEYLNKVKLEEESWKQIYNEQKEQKKKLLKELEIIEPKCIDYTLFDDEEIKYLNSGPDVATFVKETEILQNKFKIFCLKREEKRREYNLMLQDIENGCLNMKSILSNN